MNLLWKTVWRFIKKLKIELPHDPEILFLGIYLKKTKKTLIRKNKMHPTIYSSTIDKSQDKEAT